MKDLPQNRHLRAMIIVFYVTLWCAGIYFVSKYLIGLIAPFILAYLFAEFIEPFVYFMVRRLHIKRIIASFIAILLIGGLLAALLYLLISRTVFELKHLFDSLPMLIEALNGFSYKVNDWIQSLFYFLPILQINSLSGYINSLQITLEDVIPSISNIAITCIKQLPRFFVSLVIFFVAAYFTSSDLGSIKRHILCLFSDKWQDRLGNIKVHLITTLISYMKAILILIGITFCELLIGFTLIRVEYPLTLSLIVAFVDALPIFGTGTVLIPWAAVLMLLGDYTFAIDIIVLYLVILGIRQFLEPKIVGQNIGLHPLITLMSIFVGFKLLGVAGMFIGPLAAITAKFVFENKYIEVIDNIFSCDEE